MTCRSLGSAARAAASFSPACRHERDPSLGQPILGVSQLQLGVEPRAEASCGAESTVRHRFGANISDGFVGVAWARRAYQGPKHPAIALPISLSDAGVAASHHARLPQMARETLGRDA